MAKKFFKKARRRAKGFLRASKRRSSGGGDNLMLDLFSSMAYGAVRQNAAQLVQPLSQYLPLGGLSDEAALGLLGYLGYKMGPSFLRRPAKAVLMGEALLAGSSLRAGLMTSQANQGGGLQPSASI